MDQGQASGPDPLLLLIKTPELLKVQEFLKQAGVARLELATFRFGDGRSTN